MNVPSRDECEGWDQAQVAFFMCQNNMQECAVTVNQLRINGQRLLNLSDTELSRFSLLHQPQLQKMVQDIKRKDGSLLNRIRRLKNKSVPKLPVRDYRDHGNNDDELSDPEYDNDMYEDPRDDQENSYEPPPTERSFTARSHPFPRGEYLDSLRVQPVQSPKKPTRPNKAFRQLPPEPVGPQSDEDDYLSPGGNDDDDNYIEPESNQHSNSMFQCRGRAGMKLPIRTTPSPEPPPSPDFYEVPDQEAISLSATTSSVSSRRPAALSKASLPLPPKPSPRQRTPSPSRVKEQETGEDEYEICDTDKESCDKPAPVPPPLLPKPLPKERSPAPALKPRPMMKPRIFESQTLPTMQPDHKAPPDHKAVTLDSSRPKMPIPQLSLFRAKENKRGSAEHGPKDEDEIADVSHKPWYAGACDRRTADDVLLRANEDGAFMVRKSSGQDALQPYTLVVFYNDRVYNIPIRYIANTQQYALGREKKVEEHFSSVSHIIENHQRTPLVLVDTQSNSKDATRLRIAVTP